MKILETIKENVQLNEGTVVLEKILVFIHFLGITATKELARLVFLPVPVVAAVKNEFVRAGILKRDARITVAPRGLEVIEQELGYCGINRELFGKLLAGNTEWKSGFAAPNGTLGAVLAGRPGVDVTLDQSKSTAETVLKRAYLALAHFQLIGKTLLCLGDDDLVSVGLGLLIKDLFTPAALSAQIIVVDLDERFLAYIRAIADQHKLPISCYKHDLRHPLPVELRGKCHTVFTDPPYTLPGLTLFLSRALEALGGKTEQMIFLSFAHKSPEFLLKVYEQIIKMGLVPMEVIPGFNRYEGAEIIGNQGQMIALKTTGCPPAIMGDFQGLLYTGEIHRTVRKYVCRNCKKQIPVGQEERFTTIEQLKQTFCPYCRGTSFSLLEKIPR